MLHLREESNRGREVLYFCNQNRFCDRFLKRFVEDSFINNVSIFPAVYYILHSIFSVCYFLSSILNAPVFLLIVTTNFSENFCGNEIRFLSDISSSDDGYTPTVVL